MVFELKIMESVISYQFIAWIANGCCIGAVQLVLVNEKNGCGLSLA